MISATTLIILILAYIGMLFFIANWAESKSPTAKRISSSSMVYVLSLAVFCTSWTFYGSVGLASRAGVLVYTIYLGPTLLMLVLWPLMKRILLVKQTYHVNSIADFLSARYNRSLYLAGITSVVAMIGIVPYLALQLKAINNSFAVVMSAESSNDMVTWVIWFGVAMFTIAFGIRHIDPTERHPGMMLALAVEGVVKLVAMLCVGIFVCFFMFDSPQAILQELTEKLPDTAKTMAKTPSVMTWVSFLLLAGSAFFMLPRQFHVMVVENPQTNYIKKAQWQLPIYLILMTVFVMPISAAGVLVMGPDKPDTYMLTLPLSAEQFSLTLLVFIGGFSASMAMLMVSGMTLATMFSNHLALPVLRKVIPDKNFGQHLLQIRWLAIFLVFGAGQAFYMFLGDSYMLVNMGMISFCAVFQFLPLVVLGLYWKNVTARGATLGISFGFFIWAYCLFLPAIMKSGWIDDSILIAGPWGIEWLHPERLFGSNMDKVSHGAFWSLIANLSGIVLGSLFSKESDNESRYNAEFIDIMTQSSSSDYEGTLDLPCNIVLANKLPILHDLFNSYFSAKETEDKVDLCLKETNLSDREHINTQELANLEKAAERRLSGATGAAMAHVLIMDSGLFTQEETQALEHSYSQILSQLKISPTQLRKQLNYAKEKENLAQQYSEQLEGLVDNRTQELQETMEQLKNAQHQLIETEKQASLSKLVAGVAHEINTPIGVCVTAVSNLKDEVKFVRNAYDTEKLSEKELEEFFDLCDESSQIILKNNERASSLIRSFKRIAVDQTSDDLRQINIREYIDEILLSLRPELKRVQHQVEIECDDSLTCTCYAGSLSQILTNLIMNSLIHAFEPEQKGMMLIKVESNSGSIIITYKDDGVGLDEESAKCIFDPFYTTKRNLGGSGLGAHLIHNLVTQKLAGTIKIDTAIGQGLTYTIAFPSEPKDT